MNFIDTHTHLYLEEFKNDIPQMVERALESGVNTFLLPNIDIHSISDLKDLQQKFSKNMFGMMGLHPTSVGEDFENQLYTIKNELDTGNYIAIGEIGIDLYWDKTFFEQQKQAFRIQLAWAIEKNLPVAIHSRDSFDEIMEVLNEFENKNLRAVFHCFSGNAEQAKIITDKGFYLGIGGVVTFKNSGLADAIKDISLNKILLETDSPFLAPVPFRGKRNESAYCKLIAEKLAEIYAVSVSVIAEITTTNAKQLFNI